MKHSLCIIFLFLSFANAHTQVYKKFIDQKEQVTKDSTKAIFYVKYQRVEQDSNYLWMYAKYNMRNVPISTGSYLDEDMTMAHGKFVYYEQISIQRRIDSNYSTVDTVFYKAQVGFYNNNMKDGTWLTYYPNGTIRAYMFYNNGVLDGDYKTYYQDGKIQQQGFYVNGAREGDWYSLRPDSTLYSKAVYKHDYDINYQVFTEKNIYKPANAYFDLEHHIYKYLKNLAVPPVKGVIIVSFTIDSQGFLVNPGIVLGVDPALNKAVLDALNTSQKWTAATLNKKPIEQKITLALKIDTSK